MTNPVIKHHRQNSLDTTWRVNFDGDLPFKGHARSVTSVVVTGTLKNGSNVTRYTSPSVQTSRGGKKDELELKWDERVVGTVTVTARVDNLAVKSNQNAGMHPRWDDLSLSEATAPLRWRP